MLPLPLLNFLRPYRLPCPLLYPLCLLSSSYPLPMCPLSPYLLHFLSPSFPCVSFFLPLVLLLFLTPSLSSPFTPFLYHIYLLFLLLPHLLYLTSSLFSPFPSYFIPCAFFSSLTLPMRPFSVSALIPLLFSLSPFPPSSSYPFALPLLPYTSTCPALPPFLPLTPVSLPSSTLSTPSPSPSPLSLPLSLISDSQPLTASLLLTSQSSLPFTASFCLSFSPRLVWSECVGKEGNYRMGDTSFFFWWFTLQVLGSVL